MRPLFPHIPERVPDKVELQRLRRQRGDLEHLVYLYVDPAAVRPEDLGLVKQAAARAAQRIARNERVRARYRARVLQEAAPKHPRCHRLPKNWA